MIRKHRLSKSAARRSNTRRSNRLGFETLESRCMLAAPGTLDPTFGNSGLFGTTNAQYSYKVASQVDGKVIIGSQFNTTTGGLAFGVTRVLPNGTLDPAFNGTGTTSISFSADANVPETILVQPDGNIIAIGETNNNNDNLGLVARLLPDGSLDSSFGVGGKVELTLTRGLDLEAAALQPDGKLLISGSRKDSNLDSDAIVIRLLANGSIDSSFANGGVFVLNSGVSSYASGVVVQPDGKIVVAASIQDSASSSDIAVFQLLSNGQLDPNFGVAGIAKVVTSEYDTSQEVALQTDGRLVLVGGTDITAASTQRDTIVFRFNPNGSLDPTFGLGGLVRFNVNPNGLSDDIAATVAVATDNTIVVGGYYTSLASNGNPLGATGYVMRLNSNGTVDSSFGNLGVVYNLVPGAVFSLLLQANGDIVATFADILSPATLAFRLIGGTQPTSARLRDTIVNPLVPVNNKGYFGRAVAATDSYRVIGAFDPTISNDPNVFGTPAVYIFDQSERSTKLVNPTNSTNKDGFGFALDIDGIDVAVSDPLVRSVYRFNAQNGDLLRTINSPSAQLNNLFGYSVAISGSRMIVGAPGDSSQAANNGKAYLFDIDTGALLWTIANPEPGIGKRFGGAVSIDGDMVVIASPNDETGTSGKAFLFNVATQTLVGSLLPFDSPSPNGFGTDVDISSQYVVVGSRSGYAYTYSATTGLPVSSVFNLNPVAFQNLNSVTRVAINNGTAVVGAYYGVVENIPAGRATVFDVTSGDILWDFGSANPFPLDFSGEVAISDSSVFVGAFGADQVPRGETNAQGQVYEYNLVDGSLTEAILQPLPSATILLNNQSPSFGENLAATSTRLVVSAPFESQLFTQTGAAYLYDNVSNQLIKKLANPDEDDFDFFGRSIAITDQYVFVSAAGDSHVASNSGTVYRYSAITGDLIDSFIAPSSPTVNGFGFSIAANSEVLIVADTYNLGIGDVSELRVYDLVTKALLRQIVVPTASPTSGSTISITISGNSVLAGGYDNLAAYEFNWRTGALLHTLVNPRPATQSSFGTKLSAAGGYAVVGSISNFADIYNLQTGELVRQLELDSFAFYDVVTDGHILVAGSYLSDVEVYDLVSGELLQSISSDRSSFNGAIALAPALPGTASIGGYAVDATNILKIGSFDFDSTIGHINSYYLVSNSNPTGATLSTNHIAENLPGNSAVGFFTAIDPDGNDTHQYTLVPGPGDVDNAKFTLVGNQLRLIASPNFEQQNQYRVRVRIEDQDKTYFERYFNIFVDNLNDAPVLNIAATLPLRSTNEDAAIPISTSVLEMITNTISDDDPADPKGIAVVAFNASPLQGQWEYSEDNGVSWFSFSPSTSNALLLPAVSSARLRFVPAPNFNGTVSVSYRAWDQTEGSAFTGFDLTVAGALGGASAFSTNLATANLIVLPTNDPPSITIPSNSVTYVENAARTLIFPTASISDIDNVNFANAVLTLTNTNGQLTDSMAIVPTSLITFSGGNVLFNATVIGTFSGGVGTTPMVFTFNNQASFARVQLVLNAVGFSNSSEAPSTISRNISVRVTDGVGGTSSLQSQQIVVVAVNDKPIIGTIGPTVTYTENAARLLVFPTATITDLDTVNFADATLTVTNNNGQSTDSLAIVPTSLITVSGTDVLFNLTTIGSFTGGDGITPLVFTFNNQASFTRVQLVLNAVGFSNSTEAPSTTARNISVRVTDGLGGISDLQSKLVNVVSVNDLPVIGSIGLTATYTENTPRVLVFPTATITDLDTVNFANSVLTVTNTNGQATDSLAIVPTSLITVSGTNILFNLTIIGTFTGGVGTTPLVFTFNNQASFARVQLVLNTVGFASSSEAPVTASRNISVRVTDGVGGTSLLQNKLVNVVSVNDVPAIGAIGTAVVYNPNGARVLVFPTATITDLDNVNFANAVLTVTNTNGQATDSLAIIPTATITFSGANVLFNGTIIGTFTGGDGTTPLAFTFNNQASFTRVQLVLNTIGFASSLAAPTTTARTVSVRVTDGVGGASVLQSKLVNINQIPVIGSIGPAASYNKVSGVRVSVFPTATITDPNTVNFANAVLTVTNTNGQATDSLAIIPTATITVSGANVLFNGTIMGSFTGGTGTTPLAFTFNSQASFTRVQLVLNAVGFASSLAAPSTTARTITVRVTDGLGGTSALQSKLVNII